MKRLLFVTLSLFLFTAVAALAGESATNAAKAPGGATSRQHQARHVDDPSQGVIASDLPTISKFQTPGVAPDVACGGGIGGDPCVDDGGGVWTDGACNCGRICYGVNGDPKCYISVSNNGCLAGSFGKECHTCPCS